MLSASDHFGFSGCADQGSGALEVRSYEKGTSHRDPFRLPIRAARPDLISKFYDLSQITCTKSYGHYKHDEFSNKDYEYPSTGYRWSDFLLTLGIPAPTEHLLSVGSLKSIAYNMSLRRLPQSISSRSDLMNIALHMLSSRFAVVHSLPLLGDLEITALGASGIGYECCKDKRAASVNHYDDIMGYIEDPKGDILWRYMHKEGEVLPKVKVHEDKTRPIIYSPMHFYIYEMMHVSELDKQIKAGVFPWFSYGQSVTRGHFNDIALSLSRYDILFKGDCSKFDSTVGPFWFDILCDFRKRLSSSLYHKGLDHVYSTIKNKKIVLPTGLIVENDSRQPSGRAATTSDNSIVHALTVLTLVLKRLHELQLPLTWQSVNRIFTIYLYSDDHIAAANDETLASFSYRKSHYQSLGMTLKEEDDQVGGKLQDYVYLGGRFFYDRFNQKWGYDYADSSLLSCLHLTTHNSSVIEFSQTLISYMEICCFDKQNYRSILSIYEQLRVSHPYLPQPPSREYLINCQFLHESGEVGLVCA